MIKVSIIIKTLNEENTIGRAIASALEAAAPHDGEVIVADSGSTDRTVETALSYPVSVVQLANRRERCCGIGPQLGFQHSLGEYVYILDGDMELDKEFLQEAIEFLDSDPSVAGVGGIVREMRFENLEFKSRARHFLRHKGRDDADVDCLTGGGLYRRAAITDVSYLSDRNLHGFEEYDLGVRLREKGWRLVRLSTHAVDHYSHALSTYRLLWYRVRAGRLLALGEILRAAFTQRYLKRAFIELRPIRFAAGTLIYWSAVTVLVLAGLPSPWRVAFAALAVAPLIISMTIRSGSLKAGAYAVAVWHLTAVNLLLGLLQVRHDPGKAVASKILRAPPSVSGLRQPTSRQIRV